MLEKLITAAMKPSNECKESLSEMKQVSEQVYLSGTKRNQRSSFASTRWAQMMNVEGVSCAN
ncbi:MAG: hypothetical protein ACTS6A_01965 [Candidatus Hodgkinia cicadicola]